MRSAFLITLFCWAWFLSGPSAWAAGRARPQKETQLNRPLVVGFVDSGLAYHLPRFAPYLGNEVGMDVDRGASDVSDDVGHGTGVVDQFLSETERLALSGFEIRMAKLTEPIHIESAIEYLVSQNVSIISMSMSFFPQSQAEFKRYQAAVKKLNQSTLFVISAGDERVNLNKLKLHSSELPLENVLVVGGVVDLLGRQVIGQSNYGRPVDLMGLLSNLQILTPDGEWQSGRGISYIVPKVSAHALAVQQLQGIRSPEKIIKSLKKGSLSIRSDGDPSIKIKIFQSL